MAAICLASMSLGVSSCSTSRSAISKSTSTSVVTQTTTSQTVAPVIYDRSCEKSSISQAAMDACAQSELNQLDGELAAELRHLAEYIQESYIAKAQLAWLTYRTEECSADASPNSGGSVYPLMFTSCEIQMTVSRIVEVRKDVIAASRGTDEPLYPTDGG